MHTDHRTLGHPTHLEALTCVAVSATPNAQGKLVVQREEQRPGHVLTIISEKLVSSDQSLWITDD